MSSQDRPSENGQRGSIIPPPYSPNGRARVVEDALDPEEVGRLRTEVERLRNDLFLAREDASRARRQGRIETGHRLLETLGNEVRTSLTLVLGWTELLVAGQVPEEKRLQAHDAIYTAAWRVEAAIRWLERSIERETSAAEASRPEAGVEPRSGSGRSPSGETGSNGHRQSRGRSRAGPGREQATTRQPSAK